MVLPSVPAEVRMTQSRLIAPWRLPKLDRIGEAIAAWETCRCRECKRAALDLLNTYDKGKR